MKARDIMTANPSVVTPDETVRQAARIMRDENIGLVPIVDDRSHMRLEGVLTDRDIAIRCAAEGHDGSCRVTDHMTSKHLGVVNADADVSEVVRTMESEQVRRIPVVADAGGKLVGIVAQADLATKVGPKEPSMVEEVVQRISEPSHTRR